jgi:hypothetical protein
MVLLTLLQPTERLVLGFDTLTLHSFLQETVVL